MNYQSFIQKRLKIVNKDLQEVPFVFNEIQDDWYNRQELRKIILKARQQGFSSAILAKKTAKFILEPNRYIVTIADVSDNATGLLERVKYYLRSYEEFKGVKIPLKYNSKYELHNEYNNSKFIIGTAENVDVGRSKTITDLHLSEAAFYRDFRKLLASVLQAVVPDGEVDIETTANGFNEFKKFWEESVLGETGFTPLFYGASRFYTQEFLEQRKKELGRLYLQEYPETPQDAFLTSGDSFFDVMALKHMMERTKPPQNIDLIYM